MTRRPHLPNEPGHGDRLRVAVVLLGLLAPAAAAPPVAPPLEFVSASIVFGSGQPLPAGTTPARRELWGVLRLKGIKARKSDFAITALPGDAGAVDVPRVPLVMESFKQSDPADPTLFRWSARWPKDGPPEGWNLQVTYRRNRTRISVAGPIEVHFLPRARPRSTDQPEKD